MSLPEAWVDRIFAKLAVTYGHAFLGRWSGMDMATVKADWGRELARYQQSPNALSFALEHLPANDPPTVLQFRHLCSQALREDRQQLALENRAPANPDRVRQALAVAGAIQGSESRYGWLHRLRARRASGEPMSCAQLDVLKRMDAEGVGLNGGVPA